MKAIKNIEKKTEKLPMSPKVKRGFRRYAAFVMVMGMSSIFILPASATGGDPLTVVNNLSDFRKVLCRCVSGGSDYRTGLHHLLIICRNTTRCRSQCHCCYHGLELYRGTGIQYADPGWYCENGRPGCAGNDGSVKEENYWKSKSIGRFVITTNPCLWDCPCGSPFFLFWP